MSAAFVLVITDGQDTQKRAGNLQQAGHVIGPAWRRRADRHRKQAIKGAATRALLPLREEKGHPGIPHAYPVKRVELFAPSERVVALSKGRQ
jgi:hypothetical protein